MPGAPGTVAGALDLVSGTLATLPGPLGTLPRCLVASLPRCLVARCSWPGNSQKGALGAGDQWLHLVLFVSDTPLAQVACHYPMCVLPGVHGEGTTPTYLLFPPLGCCTL